MADNSGPSADGSGVQPSAKEALFFLHVLSCIKNKPDIDWDEVATKTGLSNAKSAYTRYGQIKKKLGWNSDGANNTATASTSKTPKTPKTTTPKAPRAKKDKTPGSGTNKTASKVTKPRAKKGAKAAKSEEIAGASDEDDMAVKLEEDVDDEEMLENQFEMEFMNGVKTEGASAAFNARLNDMSSSSLSAAEEDEEA